MKHIQLHLAALAAAISAAWHQLFHPDTLALGNATALHGRAMLHGTDGSITWASVTANTDRELQSIRGTHDADVKRVKDRTGKTMTLAAVDPSEGVTFDFIPVASTAANTLANAKAAVEVPGFLEKITIDDFGIDLLDGDWNYMGGGTWEITNEDNIKMTLPCRRFDGAALDAVS